MSGAVYWSLYPPDIPLSDTCDSLLNPQANIERQHEYQAAEEALSELMESFTQKE